MQMLGGQGQQNSRLASRLHTDADKTKPTEVSDAIDALRHKAAARTPVEQPPVYTGEPASEPAVQPEPQSEKDGNARKRLKQERVKKPDKPKKNRLQQAAQTLQDTQEPSHAPAAPQPTVDPWENHLHDAADLGTMPDAASYDRDLNEESLADSQKRQKWEKAKRRAINVATIILIVLCGYLSFLIFGVSQTDYVYDSQGAIKPEILSIEDKQILAEYNTLSEYYLRARILYEQALTLDYRLAVEPENSLSIAMEYEGMLDAVAKLTVDINAAEFATGYNGIKAQLLNWVKTDIAVYLQNMSAAITNNNEEKAYRALVSRDVMYNDFQSITSNLARLCHNTKGAKNGSIYSWSPESFIESLEEG